MKFQKSLKLIVTTMVFFFLITSISAQEKNDSTVVVRKVRNDSLKPKHSPKKAAILSACLPGLGQVYNRKCWKVPVIYAAIGTIGYFTSYTNGLYYNYKNEYVFRLNHPNQVNSFPEYTSDQLIEKVSVYRHYRDLTVIIMAAVYTLNIVDANVDAHLFTFDVSNNLSMQIVPSLGYSSFTGRQQAQLSFSLKF